MQCSNLSLHFIFQRSRLCIAAMFFFLLHTNLLVAESRESGSSSAPAGILCEGSEWATPWYVVNGKQSGPTVFLTGGVHGNEPAGSKAAEQIRNWPIDCGRLIVVPQVNRMGIKGKVRWFPPERHNPALRDLNRNFPSRTLSEPRSSLAVALWELVRETEPAYVVDLHEGFDFHASNPKSVGASIIFSDSDHRRELATAMLAAVNKLVQEEKQKLVPLSRSGAVPGSLVRASQDVLGMNGFILETSFKDQPLSFRTRQHRVMVSTLLQEIGVLQTPRHDHVATRSDNKLIQVALFDSAGASSGGVETLRDIVDQVTEMRLTQVGPADLNPEVLSQFDVLLFPGGSGSRQGRAIGQNGRKAVQEFVRTGGGVIGICAGAYLCSSHYEWSLHVINSAVFNDTVEIPGVGKKSMWYRGPSSYVEIEFVDAAELSLGRNDLTKIRYHNGPILRAGKNKALPEFETLAWFRTEVSRYDAQVGTMLNSPAIITAPFERGRVVCISPHPESTPGLEHVIVNAVRFVAKPADGKTEEQAH